MQIPTGEQWLRLAELIKERKLSSVGLQEAMDRAREMELSGLYKQMAQTVRSLFANRSHFKLWQMVELAVITRAGQDLEAVIEECGRDDGVGGDRFDERMKAYLTLAAGLSEDSTGEVLRLKVQMLARLLLEKGVFTPWSKFDWWRQLYEVSRERRDWESVVRASDGLPEKTDRVAAYGLVEKANPDSHRNGYWIVPAFAVLNSMPMDSARFNATAKLALTVHDKRCYEEFMNYQAQMTTKDWTAAMSLTILAVCVSYPDFGTTDVHGYNLALGMVDSRHVEIVNTIVDGLLAAGKTGEVQNMVSHLFANSEIKNAVLARLTRFYMERGLFPEARRHYDGIEPTDELLGLEILCAEVNAGKSKKKNFETLRKYVETMSNGCLNGLIMVADMTCQPRDIADAFDAINSIKEVPYYRINMILPLIRIAKRELARLTER